MVAVLTIGLIGYLLDRSVLQLQRWLSWDKASASR
jgi:nitrate/nitrite transport system permease protein